MQRIMLRALCGALLTGLIAGLAACGGGGGSGAGSGSTSSTTAAMGNVPVSISDASSDDWAVVGVKVLSIALVPQGGGSAVTVWTAPTPAPYVNLEQLDQLSEILGNVSVAPGTYTAAILTVSANPGDVLLITAPDPESGFPVAGGTAIAADQIRIQGAQGASGSLTVPVTVNLVQPLTVSAGDESNALDLEFDLGNPAFIVAHTPPVGGGATMWAVNFRGPLRHHFVHDVTGLLLRHLYGTVAVDSAGSSISITKDYPVLPPTHPETDVASLQPLTIDVDSNSGGTIVYDLDTGSRSVVTNFNDAPNLAGMFVRIAARYQEGGTLVAVRVWASSDFNKVWVSPEGHVLSVDSATNTLTVTNELGVGVPVLVNSSTQYLLHGAAMAGTVSLADLYRGFKVNVSSMDPLDAPLVADTIDIETAAFGGRIPSANATTGVTYNAQFVASSDDYSVTLDYIASGTANGYDDDDNVIDGFKWWNFTYPATVNFGADAIANFDSTVNGAVVDFGGSVGSLVPFGVSATMWGDGNANLTNWYLRDAVLIPTPVPLGTLQSAFNGTSFTMAVLGGGMAATVDLSSTMGSATLVYQINRSGTTLTCTPVDITTTDGMNQAKADLQAGAMVKVFGVPTSAPLAGQLQAYVLFYYSGTMPGS
jgi:hypothetical protein